MIFIVIDRLLGKNFVVKFHIVPFLLMSFCCSSCIVFCLFIGVLIIAEMCFILFHLFIIHDRVNTQSELGRWLIIEKTK